MVWPTRLPVRLFLSIFFCYRLASGIPPFRGYFSRIHDRGSCYRRLYLDKSGFFSLWFWIYVCLFACLRRWSITGERSIWAFWSARNEEEGNDETTKVLICISISLPLFFILRFSFDSEHLRTRGDTTWLPLVLWKNTTLASGWKPTGTSMVWAEDPDPLLYLWFDGQGGSMQLRPRFFMRADG